MFPRFMVIPVQVQNQRNRGTNNLRGAKDLALPTVQGDAKSCMKVFFVTKQEAQEAAKTLAQENPKMLFGVMSLGELYETAAAPIIEKTLDDKDQLVPIKEHNHSADTSVHVTNAAPFENAVYVDEGVVPNFGLAPAAPIRQR